MPLRMCRNCYSYNTETYIDDNTNNKSIYRDIIRQCNYCDHIEIIDRYKLKDI